MCYPYNGSILLLVLRGHDRYELVLSIVYNYNVCKMCDCTGSCRHGAKVYVFSIYDCVKLILLMFKIQISDCQKYFLFYSHVTQNDLQFVSIDSTCISNWVFVIYMYIVLTCLKDVCILYPKIMNFVMKIFILKAIYLFSAESHYIVLN